MHVTKRNEDSRMSLCRVVFELAVSFAEDAADGVKRPAR